MKHAKNQLGDYMEKSQSGIATPVSRLAGLKNLPCNRDCQASRLAGLTLSGH